MLSKLDKVILAVNDARPSQQNGDSLAQLLDDSSSDDITTADLIASSGILRDTENALIALRVAIRKNALDPKLFTNVTAYLYDGITSGLKEKNIAKGDTTAKELIKDFEIEIGKAVSEVFGRSFP